MNQEISIEVNDNEVKASAGLNINQLCDHLSIHQRQGIALAINNEVIPKSNWENHTVKEGDKIIIITASQGG